MDRFLIAEAAHRRSLLALGSSRPCGSSSRGHEPTDLKRACRRGAGVNGSAAPARIHLPGDGGGRGGHRYQPPCLSPPLDSRRPPYSLPQLGLSLPWRPLQLCPATGEVAISTSATGTQCRSPARRRWRDGEVAASVANEDGCRGRGHPSPEGSRISRSLAGGTPRGAVGPSSASLLYALPRRRRLFHHPSTHFTTCHHTSDCSPEAFPFGRSAHSLSVFRIVPPLSPRPLTQPPSPSPRKAHTDDGEQEAIELM